MSPGARGLPTFYNAESVEYLIGRKASGFLGNIIRNPISSPPCLCPISIFRMSPQTTMSSNAGPLWSRGPNPVPLRALKFLTDLKKFLALPSSMPLQARKYIMEQAVFISTRTSSCQNNVTCATQVNDSSSTESDATSPCPAPRNTVQASTTLKRRANFRKQGYPLSTKKSTQSQRRGFRTPKPVTLPASLSEDAWPTRSSDGTQLVPSAPSKKRRPSCSPQ